MHQISHGTAQKVAIIRSLLSKPDVLLLDEPTSNLDKESMVAVYDILNLFNTKYGMTVIWATHSRDLVRMFKGDVIHLDNGKIVHMGRTCFI